MADLYSLDSFNEFQAPDITAWKLTRSAIEHENQLVNHRLTWLFQSQAFLLSAFVLIFLAWSEGYIFGASVSIVPWLLGMIGAFALYICLVIQFALTRAWEALNELTAHFYQLSAENHFGKRTPPLHNWKPAPGAGILDVHVLPGALAIVWLILLVALSLLHFPAAVSRLETLGMNELLFGLAAFAVLVLGFVFGRRLSMSERAARIRR